MWKPLGANARFNKNLELLIFNRYDKFLAQVDTATGWDGIINGFALPSEDYWYIIIHPNGTQYKWHFTLVR